MKIGGHFLVKGTDWNGKKFRRRLKNGVNNNALNTLLSTYFNSLGQITTWYIGLIDNSGFTGLSVNDVGSSHPGWVENIQYSGGGIRPTWAPGTVTGQTITNMTNVVFNMTANCTIAGIFLVNNNSAGSTGGFLWSAALFPAGPQALLSGSPLNVGYTLSAVGN